ncbi:VOC family protein [Luteimonas sp. MC1782]|uniref:VOC family protein n=1 Tax=Luteimonas sp. MC1782 TaxID=2760305 RepID=UPI0016028612|nr:VOC family protein [Luteimonas sp. MC1782]MBB1473037.1 VOC family protein [Luteimonas sp. MC1782]
MEGCAKGNPVVWFEIHVRDLAKAKAFYEAMLDTTLEPLADPTAEGTLAMFAFPADPQGFGAGGALVHAPDAQPSAGGLMVYFGSDDCAAPLARALAAGGREVSGKESIGPYGFCAVVADPDGNHVGLHSMA